MILKRYIIFLMAFWIILFTNCGKREWKNPFDTNISPSDWAPSSLKIEILTQSSIKLTWKDNSFGEEGFKIDKKVDNNNWQIAYAIVDENVTEYFDDSINVLEKIYYQIYAFVGNNNSDYISGESIIINVPWDYSTIQEAIDVSMDGYKIIVQPDTYYENIKFVGKNITVASLFMITSDSIYISQTIINGNQNGSVVTFENGEDINTVLCGFTITNGLSSNNASWPKNCGGGILCYNSSNPTLINIKIVGNISQSIGGGIFCEGSSPNLSNMYIAGNITGWGGTGGSGGGIGFYGNSNPILNNVVISGNSTNGGGGGICCSNSNPSFINVTISGNYSYFGGGGIFCWDNSNPSLLNCIVWNNTPDQVYFAWELSPNSITIEYTDITEEDYSIVTNNNGIVNILEGHMDSDPLFLYPIDPSQDPTTNGDFHLQSDSPCINAGNPDPQYNDPDGTRNNMGAYGGPGGGLVK